MLKISVWKFKISVINTAIIENIQHRTTNRECKQREKNLRKKYKGKAEIKINTRNKEYLSWAH